VKEYVTKCNINLNEMVRVKLNRSGIDKLQEECDNMNRMFGTTYTPKVDENGYYENQLWEIMNKFGNMCYMGNSNPPFMNIAVLEYKEV
jgi:hypothetical protein